jgi:hypothetical protein
MSSKDILIQDYTKLALNSITVLNGLIVFLDTSCSKCPAEHALNTSVNMMYIGYYIILKSSSKQ